MTKQYSVKQDIADFIQKLAKKYGEGTNLKAKEIVEFADSNGFSRNVWVTFLRLKTNEGLGRGLYSIPSVKNVTVVASTRKPRAVKTSTITKQKTKPMAHVDVKAIIAKAAAELDQEEREKAEGAMA
jgi:hypothetical protein